MNELERDIKIDGLSSEIADLALSGATPDELKDAIAHSMEVLDSLKKKQYVITRIMIHEQYNKNQNNVLCITAR